MAEQKQPLVLALGRGYNGFYCPETRFHLVGVMKPQALFTAKALSEDVKRGLRTGVLVDVNKVLTEEEIKPGKDFVHFVTSSDRKKAILVQADELAANDQKKDKENGEEKDDYVAPDFSKDSGELISESDILTKTKKELLAFIDKTDELSLEALELTSRSTTDEVKEALLIHYNYNEKPIDVAKQAQKDAE